MFDGELIFGAISSSSGLCNISGNSLYFPTTFSPSQNRFQIDLSIMLNENENACVDIIDLELLGYDFQSHGTTFRIGFDANSFVLAMAINMDILVLNEVTPCSSFSFSNDFPQRYCDGVTCAGLQARSFLPYNSPVNKLGMDKIFCVEWSDGNDYYNELGEEKPFGSSCFVIIGDVFFLPAMSHFYRWDCDCSKEYDDDSTIEWLETDCHKPFLLLSMFYFKNETVDEFPKLLEMAANNALQSRHNFNDDYFNNITHATRHYTMGGSDPDYKVHLDWVRDSYRDLCPDDDCASKREI